MSKKKAIKNKKPHRLPLATLIDQNGKAKKNEAKKIKKLKKAENKRIKMELKRKDHAPLKKQAN